MTNEFDLRLAALRAEQASLINRSNRRIEPGNGVVSRYENPVLTADHVPLEWRYDMDPSRNPYFMERLGVSSVFNAGAIKLDDVYLVVARVEGYDRKSFFAVAESPNGIDRFTFWDFPITMPETDDPDMNVYDIRLTRHEDGWIYGVFCTERRDPGARPGDMAAALAKGGIARSRDLVAWERLPDLRTTSAQQRNVVLHPEFVDGRYAFYTRPQDGFIDAGSGGGIGWGLCDDITQARIDSETIIDPRAYHTIKETKNGLGPPPIKTEAGWLHLAHGVRTTAAGLRYILYVFVTALDDPSRIIHAPGGHLIAPVGAERIGDVGNVAFGNGWIVDDDSTVFIYYASSDTRLHVATTSIERLMDYARNTPPDSGGTAESVRQRRRLAHANRIVKDRGGF